MWTHLEFSDEEGEGAHWPYHDLIQVDSLE